MTRRMFARIAATTIGSTAAGLVLSIYCSGGSSLSSDVSAWLDANGVGR